ncbi:ABC transporter permease [Enterococcus alcedinis]|uniref:MacB-like periplasmic core domain-containing protein n=1 Tax=Enterococcus alcedinis TaxID=1274384 RepID=A0A917N4B3_9ENTE|nr:ABC transporter permease [Enterococcus alcedinis]MBP2101871.1 hypothetical protein [Enterococcus alcedinis]GGI65433.1 hypothetical protein GCM10011482_10870 [Enterococcus alcedinis]
MRKKLFFVTNFIFLIATIINAFSLFYFFHQKNLDFISNNFVSKESVRLMVNKDLDSKMWGDLLSNQKDILVVKTLESNFYSKAIYTNYKWELPLIKGRNFIHTDFFDGKNRAIIGAELLKENMVDQSIQIEGKEYEIIGILNGDYSKNLSRMALVNLNSLTKNQTLGVYQINSNQTTMNMLQETLNDNISAITYSDDSKVYNPKNKKNNNNILRYSFQLLCLFGIGICLSFYLSLSKSTQYLKQMIGIPQQIVLVEELKYLLLIWFVESILTFSILYFPFKKLIYDSITTFTTQFFFSQLVIVGSATGIFIWVFLRNWRGIDEIK